MKVLLVEDSPEIRNGISLTFRLRWPEVILFSTDQGAKGIEMVETESPDIVLLDINLPDMTGFDVLEQIRLFSDIPVIFLTVRGGELDEVRGLETGADDYIVKPFRPASLLTRVEAVLRRSGTRQLGGKGLPPLSSRNVTISSGNITVNFWSEEVFVGDERVYLTPLEHNVLFLLARNKGKIVTHETIRRQVWGNGARYVDDSTIRKYIRKLRAKLGDVSACPQIILNERGRGYRFSNAQ